MAKIKQFKALTKIFVAYKKTGFTGLYCDIMNPAHLYTVDAVQHYIMRSPLTKLLLTTCAV